MPQGNLTESGVGGCKLKNSGKFQSQHSLPATWSEIQVLRFELRRASVGDSAKPIT
jgi:hypothetical protein